MPEYPGLTHHHSPPIPPSQQAQHHFLECPRSFSDVPKNNMVLSINIHYYAPPVTIQLLLLLQITALPTVLFLLSQSYILI